MIAESLTNIPKMPFSFRFVVRQKEEWPWNLPTGREWSQLAAARQTGCGGMILNGLVWSPAADWGQSALQPPEGRARAKKTVGQTGACPPRAQFSAPSRKTRAHRNGANVRSSYTRKGRPRGAAGDARGGRAPQKTVGQPLKPA